MNPETTTSGEVLRIGMLEQMRLSPLTREQRAQLPEKLSGLDKTLAALRAYPLMDGGNEPATVFTAGTGGVSAGEVGGEASAAVNTIMEEAPHD